MSRYTVLSFTSASINPSASLLISSVIPTDAINVHKIKVTPSLGMDSVVAIYKKATALDADKIYATKMFVGTLVDPIENDGFGHYYERNEGFLFPYEDEDETNRLHLKLYNWHTVAQTYDIEITYEPKLDTWVDDTPPVLVGTTGTPTIGLGAYVQDLTYTLERTTPFSTAGRGTWELFANMLLNFHLKFDITVSSTAKIRLTIPDGFTAMFPLLDASLEVPVVIYNSTQPLACVGKAVVVDYTTYIEFSIPLGVNSGTGLGSINPSFAIDTYTIAGQMRIPVVLATAEPA